MKRRKQLTSAQVEAALRFYEASKPQPTPEPARMATRWAVHWLNRAPSIAKYQVPVPLSRVLSEHVACVAAEPFGD